MDDASSMEHDPVTPDVPNPSETSPESDWHSVQFPGQVSLADEDSSGRLSADSKPSVESTVLPPSNSNASPPSSDELIQLIQDLNHCNDALLNRISSLEESLEQSQAALQVEIERSQVVQAQGAGAVPQQIAQLLGELDIANDGLRRTTMHNEALQAELDVSQQRVAQLERECTLLQQRFNEKSAALHQAENTCRDLKSRLHRQQRYTLQFKAALEKCLNMSTQHSSPGGTPQQDLFADTDGHPQPIAIPKSQHIQPWSSVAGGAQSDMTMDDLLRGFKPSHSRQPIDTSTSHTRFSHTAVNQTPPASDPEAEAVLWKDLERVAESQPPEMPVAASTSAELQSVEAGIFATPPADAPPLEASTETPAAETPITKTPAAEVPVAEVPISDEVPVFTEPSPWGAPLASSASDVADSLSETPVSETPVSETIVAEEPAAAPQPSAPETGYPTPASDQAVVPPASVGASEQSQGSALPGYLQQAGQRTTATPSPVVYPLRSQKKRKSLAAVELPSFGRPARRR
jgi:hypothetical protein